jgi:hypothetical protein
MKVNSEEEVSSNGPKTLVMDCLTLPEYSSARAVVGAGVAAAACGATTFSGGTALGVPPLMAAIYSFSAAVTGCCFGGIFCCLACKCVPCNCRQSGQEGHQEGKVYSHLLPKNG